MEPPSPPYRVLLDIDWAAGQALLVRSDGMQFPVSLSSRGKNGIARSVHLLGFPYLVLTTDRGEDITVELPTPGDLTPLRGRPVVYLDQQAWSKVALALDDPDRLPTAEADAALWIVDLVQTWRVVLPYSTGVLTETSHWSDYERRRRLALTVAKLSRGWQMLDPLAIRAAEMRRALSGDKTTHPLPIVWTLEPGAASATRGDQRQFGAALPADAAMTVNAASSTSAVFATILDVDPIARTDPTGWTGRWASLAAQVAETQPSPQRTYRAVHGEIIGDASKELAQAADAVGLAPERFVTWLRSSSQEEFRVLPALGLAREVTYLKVINSTSRWKPNDLTDIFYLVQASGYADASVGERGFVALIQQAQRRLGRPATAHRSLADLRKSGVLDDAVPHPPRVPE